MKESRRKNIQNSQQEMSEEKDRRKVEQSLKTIQLKELKELYPETESLSLKDLHCLLSGTAAIRTLCHACSESKSQSKMCTMEGWKRRRKE